MLGKTKRSWTWLTPAAALVIVAPAHPQLDPIGGVGEPPGSTVEIVPQPPDDQVLVLPTGPGVEIPFSDLTSNDLGGAGTLELLVPPVSGTLQTAADRFVYTPGDGFWRLGADSFVYRSLGAPGGPVVATVLLLAARHGGRSEGDSFEAGALDPSLWVLDDAEGSFVLCPEAATSGAAGLCFAKQADAAIEFSPPDPHGGGSTQTGGGTRFNPGGGCPPNDPPPCLSSLEGLGALLFSIGGNPSVGVLVREAGVSYQVAVQSLAGGGPPEMTPWIDLQPGPRHLFLHWAAGTAQPSGTVLLVDDVPSAQVSRVPSGPAFELRIDAAAFVPGLGVDDVEIWHFAEEGGADSHPVFQPRIAEDFEAGTLSGWSSGGSQMPEITGSEAITGDFSVAVDAGFGGASSGLHSEAPEQETELSFAVTIDTSRMVMAPGDQLLLAGASREETPGGAAEHLRLWLRDTGSGRRLLLAIEDGAGLATTTGWHPLASGVQRLGVKWRADLGPADDGGGELWIDGQLAGEIHGLDNEGLVVESLRLGAFGIPTGTSGELILDDLLVWSRR